MLSWIAVGVILVLVVGAVILLKVRRTKTGPAGTRRPAADDAAAPGSSSPSGARGGRGSAARWLSSLVRASGEDRAKRDGHRY